MVVPFSFIGNFRVQMPAWFKDEPGFTYTDEDGDTCVVIGYTRYENYENTGSVIINHDNGGPHYHTITKSEYRNGLIVACHRKHKDYIMLFAADPLTLKKLEVET